MNEPKILMLKKSLSFLIAILLFIFIYDLNRLYPLFDDDWEYSFVFLTSDRIDSMTEIFRSQYAHYMEWGGRAVLHVIVQLLLWCGEGVCDVVSSLVFVAFVFVIYRLTNKGNRANPLLLPVVALLLWLLLPDFGESVLWFTGAVNYLWGTLIILAFLYPYISYFRSKTDGGNFTFNLPDKKLSIVLFFIFGIVAGWTNENMAVAMLAMLTVCLFVIRGRHRRIAVWFLAGYIGACIGAALMIIAPGNRLRYMTELRHQGLPERYTIDLYLKRFTELMGDFASYMLVPLAIYIAFSLLFWFTTGKENKKQILSVSLLFAFGAFVACLATVASPVFAPRAWFGIISLFIAAIMFLYANLDFGKAYIKTINGLSIIGLLLYFAFTYPQGRAELVRIKDIYNKREAELNKQKSEGHKNIVLHGGVFKKREDLVIPKMYDFTTDPNDWMYKTYSRYHEVETVVIVD
ncbi:hypothetical protein M2132_001138 [Dysgonomonas sp. PH5-45]|uniref:DUF3329 domain-containing protein n=1 Tax=unclassified Dysgonomonas TaxID=2630389 RepID=UPI0024752C45|nr:MULTISPECIES: DUF6056 family protein [unclassified Dysgonomonas]MDH6354807.1 hypothetical protein [Dysgonomonas sp. PH5-45]MDH6387706.1 hypothetical protein [Dysgonomonas sp. PH5-37]